jgi:gliding motility-associated-like protein
VRLLFTLAFLILTSNSIVWGQGICNDQSFVSGGFSLGSKDFCHDENITINNTAAVEEARYYYNYQGESYDEIKAMGSNAANFSFNSLTKSGVYTVIQVGKKDGKETVSCINDVKVRVANQPVFSYSFCPGSPAKVTVTIPSMPTVNNYTDYTINISGHPQIPKVTTLPYTQTFDVSNAVTFTISGSGGAKTCNSPATPTFLNFNPSAGTKLDYFPNISQIKITEDDKVQIDLSGEYSETYTLKRYLGGNPPTSAITIDKSVKPGRCIDTPPLPNSISYCYFVDKNNAQNCGTIIESSAEICTVPLIEVDTTSITQNPLFSYINSPVISLQKIENDQFKSINTGIPTEMFSYRDSEIHCSKKYCYRVKINTSGRVTGVSYSGTSYSNEICVDHKEGPLPAPTDVRVSTDENLKNIVYFENPPSGSYSLDKWFLLKSDGTDFLQIDEIKSPAKEIPDNLSPVTRSETYKVKYQDICENESELSKPVSSVFLAQGGDNKLEWNTSSPFSEKSIKQYEIIYINDDTKQEVDRKPEPSGSSSHTINTAPFTSSGTFKVRIIADDGTESFSNPISVPIKGALFLPTAFTPNSDGLNDTFNLEGSVSSIKEFLMEIFTQAGYKIAELTDPKTGWDGLQSDGTKAEQGPYFYKMTAVMQNGQIINKNGSFALLK